MRAIAFAAAAALAAAASTLAAAPIVVYADSGHLAHFAQRLGGDAVDARFPAPEGVDPEFWRPSIAVIAAYQGADLILLNGAGFAGWTERVSLPRGRVVDVSRGFADRFIAVEGVTHSHGPEGEHTHEGTSPYVWLDFALAAEQARAVAAAVARRAPDAAAAVEGRLAAFEAELAALDAEARALGGGALLASHPRYQYFARAYGFTVESVDWDPEQAPTAEAMAELAALRDAHPADVMLWERAPVPAMAEALADAEIVVVVLDHGTAMDVDDDFVGMMRAALTALGDALAE